MRHKRKKKLGNLRKREVNVIKLSHSLGATATTPWPILKSLLWSECLMFFCSTFDMIDCDIYVFFFMANELLSCV